MNIQVLSLIGILLGLAIFVVGIFRGYHITLVTLVSAAIISICSRVSFWPTITDGYLPKFIGQYEKYFLLFLFSALFAKLLGDTGAAQTIAVKLARLLRKLPIDDKLGAVFCVVLITAVLTYGGISLFVVSYTVVLIGKNLFEELNVPWKFYVLSSVGSAAFTLGMLPGSPQLTNLVPINYFGTTAAAAPVLGIVCSIICILLCGSWIVFTVKRSEKKGEGFLPTGAAIQESLKDQTLEIDESIPLWICLVPSVFLFVILNASSVGATMSLIYTCIFTYIWFQIFPSTRGKIKIAVSARGAVDNSTRSMLALASAAGFGGVVAIVPGFQLILASLDHIPGGPLVQMVIAVNITAGACGSSSAGLTMALDNLAERFLASGYPAEALHRLTAISAMGLDSLPHSAAVANNYYIQRESYKDAYIHNFMTTVVFNVLIAFICAALISVGLTF